MITGIILISLIIIFWQLWRLNNIFGVEEKTHEILGWLEKARRGMTRSIEKTMILAAGRANDEFAAYLDKLRAQSDRQTTETVSETKSAMAKLVADFSRKLDTLWESEVTQAKKAVESYKTARMAEIDAKAPEIMEAATSEVLGKKLKLSDQMDLIFEALEKAKKEKLI